MNSSRALNSKGLTLVAGIILIVFASVAVLALSKFIVQRLIQNNARRIQASKVYLAHAGVQQAVYQFRSRDLAANGSYSLGRTNVDASRYFVLGATAGDLLMVNTAAASLSGNGRDVLNLQIQNATNSRTITVDRMIVSWSGVPANRRLTQIRINNQNLWTGPNLPTPANADLNPNFTLNTTPTIYDIDRLRFNQSMAGATINVQFLMTDGTIRSLQVYPLTVNDIFTVKVTGKETGSTLYRSVEADYNALNAQIIRFNEINQEITP